MVDIETTGPIIGTHAMTELGAVVGRRGEGILDRFEAIIEATDDARREAMRRFEAWTRPYREQRASFIARPAAFDWPWIVQYAWRYLGENPFGFKAVCASSWFEGRGKTFRVDLPHRAVEDAAIQLLHFFDAG